MFPPEKPLDIPLIEVSTFQGYDLESQIRLGEAFESLRYAPNDEWCQTLRSLANLP